MEPKADLVLMYSGAFKLRSVLELESFVLKLRLEGWMILEVHRLPSSVIIKRVLSVSDTRRRLPFVHLSPVSGVTYSISSDFSSSSSGNQTVA